MGKRIPLNEAIARILRSFGYDSTGVRSLPYSVYEHWQNAPEKDLYFRNLPEKVHPSYTHRRFMYKIFLEGPKRVQEVSLLGHYRLEKLVKQYTVQPQEYSVAENRVFTRAADD